MQRLRGKEPEEKEEWEPYKTGLALGHASAACCALGGQVLPRIVLFKTLWKLFHLQSGYFLQLLFYWLRGRVSPSIFHFVPLP